jgi:hypothetical protein
MTLFSFLWSVSLSLYGAVHKPADEIAAQVLAGEVVEELHGLILEGIARIVRRRAMHPIAQRTDITKSIFESDSGALGAATLVIERLLGNEILNL